MALTALGLELTALYFQYGMDLKPCIMCVYQRLATIGIIFAGVVGYIGHAFWFTKFLAFGIWGVSSIWGAIIAIEHVEIQTNSSPFFTCDLFPNFPSWMPIHEWMPAIFEATGDCGKIDWQFLDLSMPQWMVYIFGLYTLALVVAFIGQFIRVSKNPIK